MSNNLANKLAEKEAQKQFDDMVAAAMFDLKVDEDAQPTIERYVKTAIAMLKEVNAYYPKNDIFLTTVIMIVGLLHDNRDGVFSKDPSMHTAPFSLKAMINILRYKPKEVPDV
ncbi:MAG: hypothetical protein LBV67_04570 [Streptococcaceae bacterium]|jgi:hypothetical protein|nr:hypothetical protein [Streptococcaceae bacterium]